MARKVNGGLADIYTADKFCSTSCGVKAKRTNVAEAIQYTATLCKLTNCSTVIFLIQEKAGFLAVLQVKIKFKSVFGCKNVS